MMNAIKLSRPSEAIFCRGGAETEYDESTIPDPSHLVRHNFSIRGRGNICCVEAGHDLGRSESDTVEVKLSENTTNRGPAYLYSAPQSANRVPCGTIMAVYHSIAPTAVKGVDLEMGDV